MWPSIIELREFYGSPRGRMAGQQLRHALRPHLAQLPPQAQIVAFGYAPPLLENPDCTLLLMPPSQGVAAWPDAGANRAVLAEETFWPLADQSVDAVLLAHGLENTADPAALLLEAWRVLRPNGRLLLVVPNRAGLWARVEATPFGRGQPFTATQLRRLLYAAQFVPEGWRRALYTPPFKSPVLLQTARLWEAIGPRLLSAHGGVIVMGAAKQLYAPVGPVEGKRSLASQLLAMPQIMPQGIGQTRTGTLPPSPQAAR